MSQFAKSTIQIDFWFWGHDSIRFNLPFIPMASVFVKINIGFILSWQFPFPLSCFITAWLGTVLHFKDMQIQIIFTKNNESRTEQKIMIPAPFGNSTINSKGEKNREHISKFSFVNLSQQINKGSLKKKMKPTSSGTSSTSELIVFVHTGAHGRS